MEDLGAKWTDEKIAELEERIKELYSEAYDEVYEKYMAFCRKFEKDDKKYSQQLKDGKITAATYRDWLRGQVFQRRRWQAQLDDLAKTLTRTNQIAMDIINEAAPGVFAMNANWAEFEIERAGNANMGFGLHDEDTVKRLLRDEPNLLPPPKVKIPEDEAWNMKAITRQINLGIVMGEGLEDIAKRLRHVADMNANQARTHARTAMTGAQNAGRIEGLKKNGLRRLTTTPAMRMRRLTGSMCRWTNHFKASWARLCIRATGTRDRRTCTTADARW